MSICPDAVTKLANSSLPSCAPLLAAQTGNIANQAPLMSVLASTSAYLIRANVPRLNIFKASQTISGVRVCVHDTDPAPDASPNLQTRTKKLQLEP